MTLVDLRRRTERSAFNRIETAAAAAAAASFLLSEIIDIQMWGFDKKFFSRNPILFPSIILSVTKSESFLTFFFDERPGAKNLISQGCINQSEEESRGPGALIKQRAI